MYPITHNWKKSLTSTLVLFLFSSLMVVASYFNPSSETVEVSDNFLQFDVKYVNHVLELTQAGLVAVQDPADIGVHTVERGDTLSGIASKYGTTVGHLKKTNKVTSTLRVGQKIFITDTSGIIHIAKQKTNYLLFASKYDLDLEDILALNYVTDPNTNIEKDDQLFLPITVEKSYALNLEARPKPKPMGVLVQNKPKPKPKYNPKPKGNSPGPTKPDVSQNSPGVSTPPRPGSVYAGKIVNVWRDGSPRIRSRFVAGYCTYWAAKRRPDIFPVKNRVQSAPFGGHAKSWLRNARAAGLRTGASPSVNAIAVTTHGGGGYGHVSIVLKVDRTRKLILIEEMNGPKGRFYVDHRWVRMGSISGYIY